MLETENYSLQTVPCVDDFIIYSLHLYMVLTQNPFLLKYIYWYLCTFFII